MRTLNRVNNFPMTIATGLFDYRATVRFDLNVVFVTTSCEIERVPETVGRFCRILTDKIGWCVTAIATGNRPVRGLQPGVKFLTHNMTVRAGGRVVGEVGPSFCICESICADA